MELLVVVAIIGLLVALMLPAIPAAQRVSRSAACINNIRQLGMAAHGYHSTHKKLPPAANFIGTSAGTRVYGTICFYLLPYLEESTVHDLPRIPTDWHLPAQRESTLVRRTSVCLNAQAISANRRSGPWETIHPISKHSAMQWAGANELASTGQMGHRRLCSSGSGTTNADRRFIPRLARAMATAVDFGTIPNQNGAPYRRTWDYNADNVVDLDNTPLVFQTNPNWEQDCDPFLYNAPHTEMNVCWGDARREQSPTTSIRLPGEELLTQMTANLCPTVGSDRRLRSSNPVRCMRWQFACSTS